MSDDKRTFREWLHAMKEIYITGREGKVIEEVRGSLPTETWNDQHGGWERTEDGEGHQRELKR